MIVKEITVNDAKIAIESNKEWLTLSKSNNRSQNQVIGMASNLSYVISQWKWTDYFKRIVHKKEPEPCNKYIQMTSDKIFNYSLAFHVCISDETE